MSDFNQDGTNKYESKGFPSSGLKAGVEDGLSMVEKLSNGAIQPEQESHGVVFRQQSNNESAGSKNGKNFTIRY